METHGVFNKFLLDKNTCLVLVGCYAIRYYQQKLFFLELKEKYEYCSNLNFIIIDIESYNN